MKQSAIFLLMMLALVAVACDEDEEATCASAVENLYTEFCGISQQADDGTTTPLTAEEATQRCDSAISAADTRGCKAEAGEMLDCMESIYNHDHYTEEAISNECNSCSQLTTTLYSCLNG